jgi:hypothetical protein
MSTNQIYSHAETQKIITNALECSDLIKNLNSKKTLTEGDEKLKDKSIKYIRSLMSKHWFYGYLSEEQFKELSLI